MPYAITAGHDATAQAAATILDAGGNAADAAIAALTTSWIAEPCMSGAAGGGFANIRTATGKSYLLDFFVQTPLQKRPLDQVDFQKIEINFGDTTEVFYAGQGSIGVPGCVAGIFEMHRRFATIPMDVLLQPAIQYAKEGVAINDFQFADFELLQTFLEMDARGRELFIRDGKIKPVGEMVKMPGMADMLDFLGRQGQRAFYEGEIAQLIIQQQTQSENGGFLTRTDFENYKVEDRQPLVFPYRNKTIVTNPLPSTGGSIMALILKTLEQETPAALHTEDYLLQLFNGLTHISQFGNRPADLQRGLQKILNQSTPLSSTNHTSKRGATTHFNIIDKDKNAIAITVSLGEGAGYFVKGTDMQMNNMLGELALLPAGIHSWIPNQRLSSMMAPTIVLNHLQRAEIVTGSGGAGRIPSAIAQVLRYLIAYQLPLQEAIKAARVHLHENHYNVEHGFQVQLADTLPDCRLTNWTKQSLFFGGAHTIVVKDGHYEAVGDQRRDGVAITA